MATDPADLQLFQPRDLDGVRPRTPRGTVDWRPRPPEPVEYPQAPPPRLGRWRWKFVLLALIAVGGGVAVWQRSVNDDQLATQPMIWPQPPAPPAVVTAPAPVPEAAPKPDVSPIPSAPAEVAAPVVTEPVPSEPPPVSKATKVKKRAHATRHAVKPAAKKHVTAAASKPAAAPAPAPTKPVGRTRPAAQADDAENPL